MVSSVGFGRNLSALRAIRQLDVSSGDLATAQKRLASGLRINSAADDAAGLSVATQLNLNTRVYTQAIRNVNDGLSALSIASGALQQLSSIVTRTKELAEQAANGVYSTAQREALDNEADALVDEYNRIIAATRFNGVGLLDGSYRNTRLQAGYGVDGSLLVNLGSQLTRNVGDGTFAYSQTYATANGPNGAIVEDFNGDGKNDLLVVSDSVTLRLGNGDGTFGAHISLAEFTSSLNMTVADLDNDGDRDVIAISDQRVRVIESNGNGTFQAVVSYVVATGTRDVQGADFDGDGYRDLVLLNRTTDTFSLMLNNGDGTFQAEVSYAVGGDIRNLIVGDLDGDSLNDILISNNSTTQSAIFFSGNGNATFDAATTAWSAGLNLSRIQEGDVNGDGILDLIAPFGQYFTVGLGDGSGSYTTAFSYNLGSAATMGDTKTIVADINEDGKVDLIFGDVTNDRIIIFHGNGNGTFQTHITRPLETTGDIGGLAAGEISGDGVLDLVTIHTGGNFVNTYLGNFGTTITMEQLDLTTVEGARGALGTTTEYLEKIGRELGNIGSLESRLRTAVNVLSTSTVNSKAAESRIIDADIAQEAALSLRGRILQQVGAAVLAQANLQPQIMLSLLQT